jgi:transcription initiation factor TFIIB
MWRLKKWNTRTKLHKSGIRNLSIALGNLEGIAEVLHLPNKVKEQAASIYRKALERDLIRGRSIKGFVAASLYAACRQLRVPRSLKEVSKASMEDLKTVSRTYRLLIKEIDLQMPVDYPMKFVPKIASETGIETETEIYAVQLLRRAKKERITAGKDPRGMASAAIYMACKVLNDKCTQREIAASAGTSEVTLRNRLRDFEEMFTADEFETFTYSQVIEQLSPNLD